MRQIVGFMNRAHGRTLRVILGMALIDWALLSRDGPVPSWLLVTSGALALIMGAWGRCLLEFMPGMRSIPGRKPW